MLYLSPYAWSNKELFFQMKHKSLLFLLLLVYIAFSINIFTMQVDKVLSFCKHDKYIAFKIKLHGVLTFNQYHITWLCYLYNSYSITVFAKCQDSSDGGL